MPSDFSYKEQSRNQPYYLMFLSWTIADLSILENYIGEQDKIALKITLFQMLCTKTLCILHKTNSKERKKASPLLNQNIYFNRNLIRLSARKRVS